jgi:hypothetical protein
MAGLDPAIQESAKTLDARIKSGHDKKDVKSRIWETSD